MNLPASANLDNRFKCYLMFTRSPYLELFAKELEYYSNADESILGVLLLDVIDNDFAAIVLARDDFKRFRAFEIETLIETFREAESWLIGRIRWHTSQGIKNVSQGDEDRPGISLFTDIVLSSEQHPYYKILKEDISHLAAKELLLEIEAFYTDIDGNFIQQFQSLNGFDARLWEIYLYCLLAEENFEIKRENDRPDFIVRKGEHEIAIEGVVVNRKPENPPEKAFQRERSIEETRVENSNDMPLRFGSALYSKLTKEYWKLAHVQGKPLIIAIADFHDDFSMTWSFPAIIDMLYGYKHSFYYDSRGNLIINPTKILDYTKKSGAKIPSGFFFNQIQRILAV